jgi:hypothetical protein
MTAGEWGKTNQPLKMIHQYPAAWDMRKVRLFWCANLRRVMNRVTEEIGKLVELVEDNPRDAREELSAALVAIRKNISHADRDFVRHPDYWALRVFLTLPPDSLFILVTDLVEQAAEGATRRSGHEIHSVAGRKLYKRAEGAENVRQASLIREVFGNPFRQVDFAPWRTDTAVALARQMYEQNDFSAMPILADALQDAGCENVNVLDHCRDPGEHVRGCWVIDMLLGKE